MKPEILYCEQGSEEWIAAHAGRVTSSSIDAATTEKPKAVTRENLKARIVAEILTGKPSEEWTRGYTNRWMQDGKDKEPLARAAYEIATDCRLEQIGLVLHPTIERAASSPDSLVGDDGVLEVKCPMIATHIGYLLANRLPPEYAKQCLWHLACTRRQWLDFVSFNPDLPPHLQLFKKRLVADAEVIADLEDDVRDFLREVDGLLILLRSEVTV